jgi:flagellar motility protein MotE (MotC chaperone)
MSGTDVAKAGAPAEEAPKKSNVLWTFLRIWLPFPLILGGILYFQFRSGKLAPPPEPEESPTAVFEGAGSDLPLLLQALQTERAELEAEWERLRFLQRTVTLEGGEIEKRRRDVEELLAKVDAKVHVMEEERDRMLGQLARVYETMKPDAAAEILSGLDVEVSTEILRRMKERAAAQVMASLDPRSAAVISQRMLRSP